MKRENTAQLFTKSFLYIFGLSDNPMLSILKKQRELSDTEKMKGDWERVGKDIQKAYDKEITEAK